MHALITRHWWALSESLTHVHTCAGKLCIFVGKEMPLRVCSNVFVWLFVVIVSSTHLWSHIGGERIRVSQKEKIYRVEKMILISLSLSFNRSRFEFLLAGRLSLFSSLSLSYPRLCEIRESERDLACLITFPHNKAARSRWEMYTLS